MNGHIYLYFLVICVLYTTVKMQTFTEEYCWRDYEGIIPSDALAGGLDRNGELIYIGQVLHENKLIPGKIYVKDNKIYFEWAAKEHSTDKNVKILCSASPQKFDWIPTNSTAIVTLTEKSLVRGGFEPNYDTYIGRALVDGETSVGKVICSTDSCLGLYTTDKGKTREHKIFEILSYNKSLRTIDVRYAAK